MSIFKLYINLLELRIGVRVSVIDGTGLFKLKLLKTKEYEEGILAFGDIGGCDRCYLFCWSL